MTSDSALAQFVGAWELFRDPILCAVVAGAVLGYLGVYIVLRRMVFVSAAVTQAAGLGVALAFFAEIHLGTHVEPMAGAVGLSLLAILALVGNPRGLQLTRESLLGLAFATCGGVAVLVGDRIAQEAHDIQSILLGTAVVVTASDLAWVLGVGATTMVLHVWWQRGLAFASFDEDVARVQGVPVRFLNAVLFVSIALMVGVATRALGALPVFAFSTLPATAALLTGVRLHWTLALATLLGALSGGVGYLLAYFGEFPVGGSQTVTAAAIVVVFALGRLLQRVVGR